MLPGLTPGLFGGVGGPGAGYQIARSLRFRGAQFLKRTFTATGNRQKWTWSGWVKPPIAGADVGPIFGSGNSGSAGSVNVLRWSGTASNQLTFSSYGPGAVNEGFYTVSGLFRDPSAWYHVVMAVDTTLSVFRCKFWVNGIAAATGGAPEMVQNYTTYINLTVEHDIGSTLWAGGYLAGYYQGYLTENYFIDGLALDASSFGEFDAVTGAWVPKKYTGTYGVTGFYLDFSDNSSLAALGTDRSGLGNHWTPGNFSVTAGVTNDSLKDTPTNGGVDTGLGGEVAGNYVTFNPLDVNASAVLSWGNMRVAGNAGAWGIYKTTYVASGKWYSEYTVTAKGTNHAIAIANPSTVVSNLVGTASPGVCYREDGTKFINGASTAYGSTYTTGNVIGIELDADTGAVNYRDKTGVLIGSISLGFSGPYCIASSLWSDSIGDLNTGQRAFSYTPTAGYKALCTQNLPDPPIKKPSLYMNPVFYTGNHAAKVVTGVGYKPDMVWLKDRSNAYENMLWDSVRGPSNSLSTSRSEAENTFAPNANFTSIDTDGFTIGASSSTDIINSVGDAHIGWSWKKGVLPGLDIVIGSQSAAPIPHSLGVKPALIIMRARAITANWGVTHTSFVVMQDYYLALNLAQAVVPNTGVWGGEPTATHFYVGSAFTGAGGSYVAYLFAEVPGFSKFGKYIGNGSTDGPFVWCGFRPRYVMVKRYDVSASWYVIDTSRDPYNPAKLLLSPNTNATDITAPNGFDFTANGFKIRDTGIELNGNGGSHIFCAFAEAPLKYSRAR